MTKKLGDDMGNGSSFAKTLMVVGGAISVSVVVSWTLVVHEISGASLIRAQREQQLHEENMETRHLVESGLSELRMDVKELLKRIPR